MVAKLTPLQTTILTDVIRHKIMSTEQIAELHYPDFAENPVQATRRAGNILRTLKPDFVRCNYIPLQSSQTSKPTTSSAAWFVTRKELRHLEHALVKQGRASDWETIDAQVEGQRKTPSFAEQNLRHEIAITAAMAAQEKALAAAPGYELVFALRTSPVHEDIKETFDVTYTRTVKDFKTKQTVEREAKRKGTVNPDIFSCWKNPDGTFSFFMDEVDLDSSNTKTFFEKLEDYYVYQSQGRFSRVAELFSRRYGISLSDYSRASFRVRTFVQSHKNVARRHNGLFARSLLLPTDRFYNFTTLNDWRANPLGAVFVNRQAFTPHLKEYHERRQQLAPSKLNQWLDTRMETLARESIAG